MGPSHSSASSDVHRDADLARAEVAGLRELRMVLDELCARGLPAAADDFPWPVLMHDGERVLQANPACLRWFGCSQDGQLVQQPLAELCRPEDEQSLRAALGASLQGPPEGPHLQRFVNRKNEVLLGRALSRFHTWGAARVILAIIEPHDGADRSYELARLLGGAVDHLSDIVFITEANSIDGVGRRIVFVNRAFTDSSGYTAQEVLGKTPSITVGDGTDRKTLARLEAGLSETRAVREDLLKYAKDGTPYWVELQIVPMFDEAGKHSHWVSIQRDITERKRLEGRLLESARLASAGQLSASLASELNSPLASVVSSLEWLADRVPQLMAQLGDERLAEAAEVLEALADARTSAGRLATATSYLPLLASNAPLSRHALPLLPLVESALVDAERQLGRPIPVKQQFERELMVAADAGRLSHAVRLALVNGALASGAERELVLQIWAMGNRVHLAVEDQGAGVDERFAGTVGAPFDARRPRGIGDALGLFVASRLVAELDGELVLLPRTAGTRVEIRLPRP